MSLIVDELIDEGVVHELGPGPSRRVGGSRGRLVALDGDAAAFLGVHFTVEGTSVALADASGELRSSKTTRTYRDDPSRAVPEVAELAYAMMRDVGLPPERLRGIGAAVPGLVHHGTGTCVFAPNLRWRDVGLRAALEDALGVRSTVRNSMHAGAIAEARWGVGQDVRSFAWVYLGSGVGAALVLEGRVFHGSRGFAGELGHWPAAPEGVLCGCGRRGCLETVASNDAIVRAAEALREREHGHGEGERLDAEGVSEAASRGDALARAVLDPVAEHLGIALASMRSLLDLDRVVVDGAALRGGGYLLDEIRASVARHSLDESGNCVVASLLTEEPMLRGAVLLAMEGDSVDWTVRTLPRGDHHESTQGAW